MPARRATLVVDVLLAAVLTGLSAARLADQSLGPLPWPATVLAVLSVAPIALRQVAPVVTMGVIVAALGGYAALGYGDFPSAGVGLVVAIFTVATLRTRAVAAAMFATVATLFLLVSVTVDGLTWPIIAQSMLVCLGAWILGDSTRHWARSAERAAADAERAVAAERTRIARELHDVVTHHMSVVTLQTGVASYVWDGDQTAARLAVTRAETAAREAIDDLGRMLDALRTDGDEEAGDGETGDRPGGAPYSPQPGLGELDALVDRLEAAGLEVRLMRSGTTRPLASGLELCAYRVVQESLTNVLKHAGPGAATAVRVAFGEDDLTVEITDAGAPARPRAGVVRAAPGAGNGIRGMRERAELYGGELEAGAAEGGGFTVRLRLPAAPATSTVDPASLLDAR